MNPQLNKKVKKYLDAYLKGTKTNSPEHQESVMLIMRGALTDANFHSEAKQLGKYFPKAGKKYVGTPMEGVIESKGQEIAKIAKWDGHDIIDAFAFYLSMSIGGSFGNRLMSLKESIDESLVEEGKKLDEKNVPTNPSKWSYYKAQAKKKFDVYPSAYANGWAAKQYKKAGGGWKSESVNEAKDKVFVVMFKDKKDLSNRSIKPSSVAYAKEADAKKFLKSIEKDGGKGMVVKSNKPVGVKVNEAATRTAVEIGGLTGMNKDAIQKFVDDNNLDIEKVYQFVKKGKLADRIKLVSAIAGKPNNPVQKKMVKQFGESVEEGMITPQRGHAYYQLYRDTPIKYVSGHSGIGLKVPGVLLHNEYDTIKGKKGAYIIDYFGAHFYVDMKNKFASRIAHPDNREQNKDLKKNMGRTALAPEHKDWKKYMNESVNEGYGKFIKAKNLTDIVALSKKKKNAVFYVTDDNNSRIGSFYLKNGKFAKATSANPNYDLQNSKTTLRDRSDVIYKYKVDESVNESQLKEFKHKVGSETIQFKVSPYRTGISLIAASGNDLDKLQDAMGSEDEVKGEIRKSLEKKLRIPIEIDRDYEGAGFGFKIDLYALAKMVK